MNKARKTTFIISFSIYAFIALLILCLGDTDKGTEIGTAGLLLGLLLLLIGLALVIPKDSREVGTAMLLSAGIIFLIGVSVCSVYPINIK